MTEEVKPVALDVELESLPIHSLRKAMKDRGLAYRPSDKKSALIKALRTGKPTSDKKYGKGSKPTLDTKATTKAIPVVPVEVRPDLERMTKSGLRWEINEDEGTITFIRDLHICANLDQPAHNILKSARDAYAKAPPVERGS